MAPVTSGKGLLACAAALLTLVAGGACSSPPSTQDTAQTVCLGRIPAEWASAWQKGTLTLPQGVTFGVNAVAGDLAFGQYDRGGEQGVGSVDLGTGKLTALHVYAPGTSGLGALAVEGRWVVWEQLDSATDLSAWSVHSFDLSTGTRKMLVKSSGVPGPQPMPVLSRGVAAWTQPLTPTTTQLVTRDLATGEGRVLASGSVSAPVHAGPYLLWSEVDGQHHYSFKAVDAATQAPATLPAALPAPTSVGYLGGSPDYLVWSSLDATELTTAHLPDGARRSYTLADRRHFFQFLQLSGDFVVWYSGITSSILDLTTGKGFDLAGTVAGSPAWIAAATPHASGYAISRLSPERATRITACTA